MWKPPCVHWRLKRRLQVVKRLTNLYLRWFIVQPVTVEDEGYLCVEHVVIKFYGRNYKWRMTNCTKNR
nr:MAG TPA: hypothetical protein [Caudoviricetes sp.]